MMMAQLQQQTSTTTTRRLSVRSMIRLSIAAMLLALCSSISLAFQPSLSSSSSSSSQRARTAATTTTTTTTRTGLFLSSQSNDASSNKSSNKKNRPELAFATAALSALLFTTLPLPALATPNGPTAAQIALDQIPPTSISVQIGDLPVIGSALSGTYTKLPDSTLLLDSKNKIQRPSITIRSPSDKVKAIQELATTGHLEFDVTGRLRTHLDIDVAADEPGVATIRVASNLIPKLPFKNSASTSLLGGTTGGKESQWNVVTNLGTGESYYYNMKTGVTQLARPDKL